MKLGLHSLILILNNNQADIPPIVPVALIFIILSASLSFIGLVTVTVPKLCDI